MTKIALLITVAALALGGCVQHRWVPGPEAAGDYGRVSGQCKLMAMAAPSGGFVGASGSPKLVGAVVGGGIVLSAIGSAVRQQNVYNACMESAGFVAADAGPGAVASQ